jgi:alkylhydroperoxidase/carboxymuconolactone decarboxylase family protein YurZ
MAESTTETPVLDLLANMTANSMAASSLDPETLMLVRIAALVAVDAPLFSYVMNLEVASELDIDPERIRGVLAAVAPIVGTPRVASATGKLVEALAVEIEIAEFEEEEGEEAEEPIDEYEEEEGEEVEEPTDESEEQEASRDKQPEEPVARSPRRRRSASPAGRRRG